ncbi:MAG: lipoprotein [Lachnospiraceae bacterium]
MKKCLIFIGLMVLTLSLTGCGRKAEETPKESAPPQNNVETTEAPQSETQIEQGTDVGLTGETVGKILLMDFERYIQENPDVSAQEMADHILANSIIQFSGTTMAVEEGLLAGFNNVEITGFDEGVMFAPMIGSIPFVGYIFTLPDGADTEAFLQLLTDNADPRWNICTEADETVTGKAENMIFFVMSPAQF